MNKQHPRQGSDLGKAITPFVVISDPYAYKHNIYLQNFLESPEEMIAILDVLNTSSEEDRITIHLNSGGGDLSSLDTLLHAMANCPAHIHVVASGVIASAATFVLLAADSYEMSAFTTLLFHTCTFGVYGQSQDNVEYTLFIHKENERLMREYYRHLFTEDEIDDIILNKRQKWLTAEEFCQRFDAASKAHKEDYEKAQEAQQSSLEQMYAELDSLSEMLPDEVIDKLSKQQLRDYIKGTIEVKVNEDGSYEIIEVEEIEE